MANAIKCDRCGVYADFDEYGQIKNAIKIEIPDSISNGSRIDLCGKCAEQFRDFMKGRPGTT